MVSLRVFSVSEEAYNLAAETVVALAKPVIDIWSLMKRIRECCGPSQSNQSVCITRGH